MRASVLLVLAAMVCFDIAAARSKGTIRDRLRERFGQKDKEDSGTSKDAVGNVEADTDEGDVKGGNYGGDSGRYDDEDEDEYGGAPKEGHYSEGDDDDLVDDLPEGEPSRYPEDNDRYDVDDDVTDDHHGEGDDIRHSHFHKPRCANGRCECEDPEIKANFLAGIGNVVAKCQMMGMQAIITNTLKSKNKKAPKVNKKMRESKQFDFYLKTCMYLAAIGQQFKDRTFEMKVRSCCDYKQLLGDLHCLHTYMTLADMSLMRAQVEKVTKKPQSTDTMVTRLEEGMKGRCDALYRNPICLVMELTDHADKKTCADVPRMKGGSGPKGDNNGGSSDKDKSVGEIMDDNDDDMEPRLFDSLSNMFSADDEEK